MRHWVGAPGRAGTGEACKQGPMVGGAALPNIVTQIKLYLVIPKLFISPAAERYAVGRLTRWRLGNSFSISKRNASHIDDRNDCPNRTEQQVPNISKYVSAN
jgi:hypothetical protein